MAFNILKVAEDGSGHYKTVQDAVDAIPVENKQRVLICVAPGTYQEPIYVPKNKKMISLLGDHPETTILTWDNTATTIQHDQAIGTFGSGTVIIEGEGFIAQGITFENSAPKGSGQAVAIRVSADQSAFFNCRFLGWQDTAYMHRGRIYIRDCYIEGSVDFIFGKATVLLEHCHIHCKSSGFITAQKRAKATDSTGFVFLRCTITGTGSSTQYVYLGRPWGPHARVVYAYTYMDACIKPEGWHNWNKVDYEKTTEYYEYRCSGPGSDTSKRVAWAKHMKDEDIVQFTSLSFIDVPSDWLSAAKIAEVPFIPLSLSSRLQWKLKSLCVWRCVCVGVCVCVFLLTLREGRETQYNAKLS